MSNEGNIRTLPELEKLRNIRKLTDEGKENYKEWKYFQRHYDVRKKVKDAIAGRLDYMRPEPPEDPRTIENFGKPLKEQKFNYHSDQFKATMETWMDDTHVHHQRYLDFIKEEDRRLYEGFWFFNGGNLEYITGYHYLFLQIWKSKITIELNGLHKKEMGSLSFRDAHRDVFYAYDNVRTDNRCHGLLFYSFRRFGKTLIALFLGYIETILYRDQKFTMQSKNEKDGKSLYKKIIESWKVVPMYYKPNDTKDTNPQSGLYFSESKKIVELKDREYSEAYINSDITYESSIDSALDGLYYSFIFHDEVGKVKTGIDVNERWNIAKECISDGTTIVGKAFVTSTIESFEKYAAAEAKTLWERSDTENPDPILNRTDSGLYQLFFPAYYGLQGEDANMQFVDEWGYTDIKRAHDYISAMYDYKKGEDLLSFRRKFPLNINDSFALADGSNNFSKERIYQQKKYNNELSPSPAIVGNFMWVGGVLDSTVEFYPDKDGRWEVSWMPLPGDRNKRELRGGHYHPTRDFARSGVDTFDQSFTRGKGSFAASVVSVKHYPKKPEADNGIVSVYLHRQKYAEDFFEDMIMQCVFFSSPILAESNKGGMLEHFRRRGYDGFALKDPLEKNAKQRAKPAKGIPMSGDYKRNAMVDGIQAYIYDHVGYNQDTEEYGWCPHSKVLDEWLRFDAAKWTEYDLTVATGMSFLAWTKPVHKRVVTKDISQYFNRPKK